MSVLRVRFGDLDCHPELLLKALGTCRCNCDSPCIGQAQYPAQIEATCCECRANCTCEMRPLLAPIEARSANRTLRLLHGGQIDAEAGKQLCSARGDEPAVLRKDD